MLGVWDIPPQIELNRSAPPTIKTTSEIKIPQNAQKQFSVMKHTIHLESLSRIYILFFSSKNENNFNKNYQKQNRNKIISTEQDIHPFNILGLHISFHLSKVLIKVTNTNIYHKFKHQTPCGFSLIKSKPPYIHQRIILCDLSNFAYILEHLPLMLMFFWIIHIDLLLLLNQLHN